jgi:hypothetical protein
MGQFLQGDAKKNLASATILVNNLTDGKRLAYLMLCPHVESGPQHSSCSLTVWTHFRRKE